jgi:hypothetical protein
MDNVRGGEIFQSISILSFVDGSLRFAEQLYHKVAFSSEPNVGRAIWDAPRSPTDCWALFAAGHLNHQMIAMLVRVLVYDTNMQAMRANFEIRRQSCRPNV